MNHGFRVHIPTAGGQAASQPMLGVIPCEYADEHYLAKNLFIYLFKNNNTGPKATNVLQQKKNKHTNTE